jgi:ribosomal protein S18 acetylase RimI-like enzyme
MSAEPKTASGWHPRMYRSFAAVIGATAAGTEGGRALEPDGVCAAVTPAIPERSVFNSVVYEDSEALARSLDDLAAAYDDAGVRAWTVWVPESDLASARLLERAGHELDANPLAMVLDLDDLAEADRGELDWDHGASVEEVCRVNDLAYGYPGGTFERGLGVPPDGVYRFYRARLEGETACVVATADVEGDCGMYWVATLPEARGRGLVSRLMSVALAEGRERGCDISTLQATKLGRPVYERLGYRDMGTLQMWERRQ